MPTSHAVYIDMCTRPCFRLEAVQQQLAGMQSFVAKAEGWRRRWEVCQMEVEDLMAADARATMRRQELVSSYWPVMERLGAAEDVVAALTQQVRWVDDQPTNCALGVRVGHNREGRTRVKLRHLVEEHRESEDVVESFQAVTCVRAADTLTWCYSL